MIVDTIFRDGECPIIYSRYRDEDRNLIERREEFHPYFWVPADTPDFRLERLKRSFPGTAVRKDITATGLDKTPLIKIETDNPFDITRMSKFFDKTYEADIPFVDQWLMENVPEMPDWKPRKWWYDIECNTGDDNFTTVIAVIDSDLDMPVVFAWADERTNCPYPLTGRSRELHRRKVRDVEYELHLCFSEKQLHENFIDFLHERDPDMMIAHAGCFFDIPHLINRINKSNRLSPLGFVRRPKRGEDSYYPTDQPIAGRWQFDTAAREKTGTGFERVYKDSGGGQLPNLKLNTIAEHLKLGSKLTEEIEGMSVHNGWYEYWGDFVDYCLLDTELLRGIDEARNVTDFYVEMVRLCGVSMQSTTNVTKFARGLLSRRTELKSPSRTHVEKEELKGAEFILKDPGLYENVGIIDYKGMYPSFITGYNLCYTTKRSEPGPGIIKLDNGSYWDQTQKGILPQVVDYLFDYRAECKRRMRDAETDSERAAWNTTQSAVKRVMASLYGMTAHVGYGWADADIAHTITSEGRRCIRLLDKVATDMGYETLYGFTDSAFIKVPQEEAEDLAKAITKVVQETTGNKELVAELEAWMPRWILVGANAYAGRVAYPVEDAGKVKSANFLKGSALAPITKGIQKDVLNMIFDGASEQDIREHVLSIVRRIKTGDIDWREVTMSTRLGMPIKQYKTLSGASKAADYYNRNIAYDPFDEGDSVQWTYVDKVPGGMEPTEIIAFREPSEVSGFTLDTSTIIDKMIGAKLKGIYKVLGWDLDGALGAPRPKNYGWW
tara:strand:+ start:760 stop:3099 length:2340 start_codon:yes stop_codon:yes gene_type:complete